MERDSVEGDGVEGDGVEGDGVEGDSVEGDRVKGERVVRWREEVLAVCCRLWFCGLLLFVCAIVSLGCDTNCEN